MENKIIATLQLVSIEPESKILVRRIYPNQSSPIGELNVSEVPQTARKYLYRTFDDKIVETGLYAQQVKSWHDRPSIEISTQIGCPIRCIMCASGEIRFVRNLTDLEMVSQVLMTKELARITHDNIAVSAMGTGETSLNFVNLSKAFQVITKMFPGTEYRVATMGANLSAFDYWAKHMPDPFQLVPSLHSATQASRKRIIPGSTDINAFISAIVKFHNERPDSRVLIKYVMMQGINDADQDVDSLRRLLDPVKDFACLQFCILNSTPFSQANALNGTNDEIINEWMCKLQPDFSKNMLSLKFIDAQNIACGQTTSRFLSSYR